MSCCKISHKVWPTSTKLLLEEIDLEDVQLGDLIELRRYYGLYAHWAVYVGNGEIIHLAPPPSKQTYDIKDIIWLGGKIVSLEGLDLEARVRKDKITAFIGNSSVLINNEFDPPLEESIEPFPKDEIVKRAHNKLGENGYELLSYNCEHFATECRYGVALSKIVWDDDIPVINERAKVVAVPGRKPIPSKSLPKTVKCAKKKCV